MITKNPLIEWVFLFPYILDWLKKNGWQHVEGEMFYKDNPDNGVQIFDQIEPFTDQDTDPRDSLWDDFEIYMDENY